MIACWYRVIYLFAPHSMKAMNMLDENSVLWDLFDSKTPFAVVWKLFKMVEPFRENPPLFLQSF